MSWQVLHIPAMGWDGLKGVSPIAQLRNAIGLGIAAEHFAGDFYANDGRPSLVIETPSQANRQQGQEIKDEMASKFAGAGNKWKTLVLGPGIKLHTVTMPMDDAQFLETRKLQKTEIYGIYRVPPHLAGDLDKATFSNIEQQDIGFAKHCILPWARKIEAECNHKLFSPRSDVFCEMNLDGLLRGDFKTRSEGYQALVNSGAVKRSEVRRLENLPEAPEVDHFVIQGAMALVLPDGTFKSAASATPAAEPKPNDPPAA